MRGGLATWHGCRQRECTRRTPQRQPGVVVLLLGVSQPTPLKALNFWVDLTPQTTPSDQRMGAHLGAHFQNLQHEVSIHAGLQA